MIGFDLAELQSSRCCSCDSFPFAFYKRRLIHFVSLEILHDSSFIIVPNFFPNPTVIVAGIDTICRSAFFRQNVNTPRRGLDQICIPTIQTLLASSYMLSPDF